MSSKIAFVGAPGTYTDEYQLYVSELMEKDDTFLTIVRSNIGNRILNSIEEKYVDYFIDSEEIDLASTFTRRIEVLSANPECPMVANEWALTELANVMVKMKEAQDNINKSVQILGPDGQPTFTGEHGKMVILQSIFQVILNQVAFEQSFWDFVYYAPICPEEAGILNEDGIAPKDRLRQKEIDLAITSLIAQLNLEVVKLPDDRVKAKSFLTEEKVKWRN